MPYLVNQHSDFMASKDDFIKFLVFPVQNEWLLFESFFTKSRYSNNNEL